MMRYRRSHFLETLCAVTGRSLYDIGILGGGTLINQHHMWLTQVRELRRRNVPMICLGTGVAAPEFWCGKEETLTVLGHAGDELDGWTSTLAMFSFVGVRGPYSLAILSGRGLNGAFTIGDTALSLWGSEPFGGGRGRPGVLGLSVGHVDGNPLWGDPDRYMSEVVRFAQLMCDSGYEVHLLPVWDRDVPSNESILAQVDRRGCRLLRVFDVYNDYSRAVRECEIFVGQKLHSTVIACINGVPSVMIEYRPKCRDFMASLDLEEYVIRTDNFTAETAAAAVDRLRGNTPVVLKKLERRIADYCTAQSAIAETVNEFLWAGRQRP